MNSSDGEDSNVEEPIPVQRDDIVKDDDQWINDAEENGESDGEPSLSHRSQH